MQSPTSSRSGMPRTRALSPAERREFEEHLAGCPACRAAVSGWRPSPACSPSLTGCSNAVVGRRHRGVCRIAGAGAAPVMDRSGTAAFAVSEDDQDGADATAPSRGRGR
jgi:anti-sigma factor RsiW